MKTFESQISFVPNLLIVVALVSAIAPSLGCASQMTPTSSDVAEIESISRDYIEGWYTGDVERMDRALHSELVKRIPVNDEPPGESRLHPVSRARMLELTAEGGGEDPDADFEIFIDDVSTDIATARVVSPEYVDYLHLARTEGGWKIVHVLFRTRH